MPGSLYSVMTIWWCYPFMETALFCFITVSHPATVFAVTEWKWIHKEPCSHFWFACKRTWSLVTWNISGNKHYSHVLLLTTLSSGTCIKLFGAAEFQDKICYGCEEKYSREGVATKSTTRNRHWFKRISKGVAKEQTQEKVRYLISSKK